MRGLRRCSNPSCPGDNRNLIDRDYVGASNIMRCGENMVEGKERPESLKRGGGKTVMETFFLKTGNSSWKERKRGVEER